MARLILILVVFFRSASEEGFCCKPKYRANLFKSYFTCFHFIFRHFRRQDQSAVCILHFRYILLIQVFKGSGTTHRFVAVVLQILIVFSTLRNNKGQKPRISSWSMVLAGRSNWQGRSQKGGPFCWCIFLVKSSLE